MHHDDIDRLRLSPTTQMSPEFMEGAFWRERNRRRERVSATTASTPASTTIQNPVERFFCCNNWSSSWILYHGSYRIDEIEKHQRAHRLSITSSYTIVMSSAGLGSGKQFDNCSSSYQSSSLRSDVLVVCEVMSWYLTRVHLTAAS